MEFLIIIFRDISELIIISSDFATSWKLAAEHSLNSSNYVRETVIKLAYFPAYIVFESKRFKNYDFISFEFTFRMESC